MTDSICITDAAQTYLAELLEKQDEDILGVRIFINGPGTPRAETCIAYCREADRQDDDEIMPLNGLTAYIEKRSVPFLEDAVVDFNPDQMGGQLTIKAPNAKMPKVGEDSPVEDRVNYILFNEINPQLAAHGGEARLVEITEDDFAVLEFGGGCQGCAQIDLTVRQGVERMLVEQIPQLQGVRDVTDHSDRSQAYF